MNKKNYDIILLIKKMNIIIKNDIKKLKLKKLRENDFKYLVWKNFNNINNGK